MNEKKSIITVLGGFAIGAIAGMLLCAGQANAQSVSGAAAGSSSESAASAGSIAGAVSGGSASNAGGGSANASPTIVVGSGNNYEAPDYGDHVPTMFIPNLTTSNGTCANSFSMGGSGAGFGVAFGKTYVSGPCNARFNANQLNSLGMGALAMETMCGIKSVYEADQRLKAQGRIPKCVSKEAEATDDTAVIETGPDGEPVVIWFDDKEMDEVDALAMNDAVSDPNSNDMTDYELGKMYAEMYGEDVKIWGANYKETQSNR